MDWRQGGEELGGVERGKIIFKIYYVKKIMFNIRRKLLIIKRLTD